MSRERTRRSAAYWRDSPAGERNKGPILEVLKTVLPSAGLVLEVASGTGQHVAHFAGALPQLTWQPSEPDETLRRMAEARIAQAGLSNLRAPLALDVREDPWPVPRAEALLCINMIHIAPWAAAEALLRGARRLLPDAGVLILYGPYRRRGGHTAPSNEAFDADLRARNPDWGVRDLEAVTESAERSGLRLDEIVAMPANNLTLVLRKADFGTK